MVSSSPLSPSAVCSCAGPAGADWVELGAGVLALGAEVLVPGADGFVLGADGSPCWVGCALVVGWLAVFPSGQMMTATTAMTMTTATARPAKIQMAGLCHHGEEACAC